MLSQTKPTAGNKISSPVLDEYLRREAELEKRRRHLIVGDENITFGNYREKIDDSEDSDDDEPNALGTYPKYPRRPVVASKSDGAVFDSPERIPSRSNAVVETSSNQPTQADQQRVLRLKRKQFETPPDTLVVEADESLATRKRARTNSTLNDSENVQENQSGLVVFKLVRTVASKQESVKALRDLSASSLRLGSYAQAARALQNRRTASIKEAMTGSKVSRYRAFARNREQGVDVLDLEEDEESVPVEKRAMRALLPMLEEMQLDTKQAETELPISAEVYDMYIVDEDGEIGNNYATVTFEGITFMSDESDAEVGEEEEDSNDEGHWANEYPDEDEFSDQDDRASESDDD
ncbi:hypothetical protein BJ742DRAFT_845549 [Cladochytrium replicatum]|nr:hypothetical protein BJ742DRAFT_845549 [Cladochytrium replicatum]